MTSPFVGSVLTGGSSSRFGVDKALFVLDGVALAERVALALRGSGADEVLAIGGDAEALGALGCFDRVVPDRWPGEGPLGGVVTALGASEALVHVVLACDTPAVTAACPRSLVRALDGPGSPDVAVGVVGGRSQPLTAAWRRRSTLGTLTDAFAAGERAPRAVLAGIRVAPVVLDEREVADVDRPGDLSRYDARARGGIDASSDRSHQ